jgi:hypothetical protein
MGKDITKKLRGGIENVTQSLCRGANEAWGRSGHVLGFELTLTTRLPNRPLPNISALSDIHRYPSILIGLVHHIFKQ